MKSPPPPPPPITNCIPMRTDKRGIPIVQTSPLRTRRHLERECDEIRLCRGKDSIQADYYTPRMYSPSTTTATTTNTNRPMSSPRMDSWQDASTEHLFPHKKHIYSPRPQPSIYMNRKQLKRKPVDEDFGLNSPCSKISRLSTPQRKLEDDDDHDEDDDDDDDTLPQTQPMERMFEIDRMETERMIEKIIRSPKMRIQSIIEPTMVEPRTVVRPVPEIQPPPHPPSPPPILPPPPPLPPAVVDAAAAAFTVPEISQPVATEIYEPEDMVIDPPEPVAPITPLTTSTATVTTIVATTPVITPAATPVATPAATPVTTPAATETAPPHTTSATTLTETKKPSKEEEDARVAEEIDHLMKTVKGLPDYYKLIDKIGEGTFSTVYKALDIRRDLYHNGDWEPQLMVSEEEQKTMNQYVALKRIYHTSSPRRIANEVYILRKLIGSPCISPLITAFRQQDQVFVVMPYIPHDDFKKTFHEMPMLEIKSYMKALLTALHYLHKQNILHRDVKPNNFLYNRRKRTGYLIDFGLAENEEEGRKLEEYTAKVDAKSQSNMFIQSSRAAALNHTPCKPTSSSVLVALTNKENRASTASTTAGTTGTTISANSAETDRKVMGYVKNDARHQVRANRAGTRGFRAPEILMKVTRQTCAIDIWAAGVILSCFLTGRYPFFLANEESDAIMELAQIYGYREMKKCASSHGRTFSTNINIPLSRIPWFKLVEHLNKEAIQSWDTKDYKDALDLLDKCMDLNPKTRITATDALQHPFFS